MFGVIVRRAVFLSLVLATCLSGQSGGLECSLEFRGFDTLGQARNDFELIAVDLPGDEEYYIESASSLKKKGMVIDGPNIRFSPDHVGPEPVSFGLQYGPDLTEFRSINVELASCLQRQTVFLGRLGYEMADAGYSISRGRLKGCEFDGDWWVRVDPLFGPGSSYESDVEPETGLFTVVSATWVRHVVLVGKGGSPVKAFTIDGNAYPPEDLGSFDLGGDCPSSTE